MHVSKNWLSDWVKIDVPFSDLADSLSLAGLEVASIEEYTDISPKVVVGQVVSLDAHPRSDKLKICMVDVGRTRSLQIVCGAPNAKIGLKTAVALIGAELPGGMKIAKTRVRDFVSSGMMCSAAELGIGEDTSGIMELDKPAKNGTTLNEYLKLEDTVLEIELTPNRGDCLSVLGIATEVSVLQNVPLKRQVTKPVKSVSKLKTTVEIKVPEDCPRYACRVIEGINLDAGTPDWICERLRKAGHRSISLAVDITNYVMLELGQPMHAFDLDKLRGGIGVRHAQTGEFLDLLDGSHVKIPAGTLIITDQSGPIALAGIMGGNDSAINDSTTNILLESACFNADAIAGRARMMGMHTDASHRFERHVDPELQVEAIHRATQLLVDAAGGKPGPVVDQKHAQFLRSTNQITLRKQRLALMLGITIQERQVERIFTKLGMPVKTNSKSWRVSVPSRRADITGEHDLIEEVARIYGYDNIPDIPPNVEPARGLRKEINIPIDRLKLYLVDRDYNEAINYSFVDPSLQKRIAPDVTGIDLKNPISSSLSVMRVSLLPGLLNALSTNYRRQQRRIRLFEGGHVFLKNGKNYEEINYIAGVTTGKHYLDNWQSGSQSIDFYDMKGDVEGLLQLSGCENEFSFEKATHAPLHPGQSASILRNGMEIGWLGSIHPNILNDLGIEQAVFTFQIRVNEIMKSRVPEFHSLSKFPSTTRDLSILVDESVVASQLLNAITQSAGKRLKNIELFDVYRGKGVPEGKKSMSYTLTLQESSSNLTEQAIEEAISRILTTVEKQLDGKLRT